MTFTNTFGHKIDDDVLSVEDKTLDEVMDDTERTGTRRFVPSIFSVPSVDEFVDFLDGDEALSEYEELVEDMNSSAAMGYVTLADAHGVPSDKLLAKYPLITVREFFDLMIESPLFVPKMSVVKVEKYDEEFKDEDVAVGNFGNISVSKVFSGEVSMRELSVWWGSVRAGNIRNGNTSLTNFIKVGEVMRLASYDGMTANLFSACDADFKSVIESYRNDFGSESLLWAAIADADVEDGKADIDGYESKRVELKQMISEFGSDGVSGYFGASYDINTIRSYLEVGLSHTEAIPFIRMGVVDPKQIKSSLDAEIDPMIAKGFFAKSQFFGEW